jgi:hypothetical protein
MNKQPGDSRAFPDFPKWFLIGLIKSLAIKMAGPEAQPASSIHKAIDFAFSWL